ncbi:MAG TPA: imidazole glycerol phosphate synthase subunit HisF [Bacillota bacterium]|jgi:cyclase
MLYKRIIPCLDLKAGRVVKGVKFADLRDAGDPVEQAAFYSSEGADELVCLDIAASREGRGPTLRAIEGIAEQVFIPLTAGGGLAGPDDVRATLLAGADRVSLNTQAVLNPGLIEETAGRFGRQCVVVAIDFRSDPDLGWRVCTHGGSIPTELSLVAWARRVVELGAGELLLTSMDRDGTVDGYDLGATRAVADAVTTPVIASGGAGRPEDVAAVLSEAGGADAALAASIFHYRQCRIADLKAFLRGQGVPVR